MIFEEKKLDSKKVFSGKILNVRVDTVKLPDGRSATREIVEHQGAVTILPMADPESVILVRQYRYPSQEVMLELPAGKLEAGEDPAECAARELAEEIGYLPGKLEKLMDFYAAPGYCQERMHLFLATDLIEHSLPCDDDEFLEKETYPLAETIRMIQDGRICDAKTIIGLLLADRMNLNAR